MMLKAGFTDYLTKPVTLNEMEQMLLKYLPADKVFKTQNTDVYEEETTSAIGASALSEAAASVEAQAKESDAESLKISVPKLLEKYRTLGEKLGKH